MKVTRRNSAIAAATACVTIAAGAVAQTPAKLESGIFDWDKLTVEPTEVGARREIVRGPTATLDEFRLHATTLKPGAAPHAPHRHPHEEMIVVKEGNIEVMIGQDWKPIGPGSVAFFASNTLHGIRNASATQPASYHVLIWRTPATPKQ
jgi:quercetin dioxygenase-like cupin family protein